MGRGGRITYFLAGQANSPVILGRDYGNDVL